MTSSQGENDTNTLDKQLNKDVQDQIRNLHLDNDQDSDSSSSYDNPSVSKLEGFEDDDAASTLYDDTTSTFYSNDDTSTLVGGNEYARPAATKHITADDLRNINIEVAGYDIRLDSKGKETIYCILSVRQLLRRNDHQDLINNRYRELWKIAKCYADLTKFDSELKDQVYHREALPDKNLFSSHAPIKVDERKYGLEFYFKSVIIISLLPLKDHLHICEFFSTGIVSNAYQQKNSDKEGYLSMKGKLFGGWKSRYFVQKGSKLDYYEIKGGALSGSIDLRNAMIGSQKKDAYSTRDGYRHALLISEGKYRNMLCAHSEEERDKWLTTLYKGVQQGVQLRDAYSSTASNNKAKKAQFKSKDELFNSSKTYSQLLKKSDETKQKKIENENQVSMAWNLSMIVTLPHMPMS